MASNQQILQVAQLACVDIYEPVLLGAFDHLYHVGETVCGLATYGGISYVICQGTDNVAGLLADADILATSHPVLGELHAGFYENIPALLDQIRPDIPVGMPV